jgi:hypothetical protein
MKIKLFFLLLSIISTIYTDSSEPKYLKPDALSNELFCVGCLALSIETVKILKGRKGESDVYDALNKVCRQEYSHYGNVEFKLVFSPREVSESCQIFRDLYDEYNLEEFFMNRGDDNSINTRLCMEKTTVI